MKNPPYNLITILAIASFGMVNLFIYCFFGKMTTENFANMPDYLYFDMKWHKLSVKLQTYIVLMIQNMHKPIFYHGFDVAVMNLNTFLQVSMPIQLVDYSKLLKCWYSVTALKMWCIFYLIRYVKRSLLTIWCSRP